MIYLIPIATTAVTIIILLLALIYYIKKSNRLRTQRDSFADRCYKLQGLINATDSANQKYKKYWAENHPDPNVVLDVTKLRDKKEHLTDP